MEFNKLLAVYFVWHPNDENEIKPIFKYCYEQLSKNIEKPFSRTINIPMFLRVNTVSDIPLNPYSKAKKTLVFIFLTDNMTEKEWVSYLKTIALNKDITIIPIALCKNALNFSSILNNVNFIRAYELGSSYYTEKLFMNISHGIYTYLLNDNIALKLFISHAKDGKSGELLAEKLKKYIDKSIMKNFFDATDIDHGARFENKIIENIKDSTMISIQSDIYSSRYWCQREIIAAKEHNRPIICVDTLDDIEDRKFPFSINMPCVHTHIKEDDEEKDILRILNTALIETIRYNYSNSVLSKYIKKGVEVLSKPPELHDIIKLINKNKDDIMLKNQHIIYPDPPVYSEEIAYLDKFGVKCSTPLTNLDLILKDTSIGISISEPSEKEMNEIGIYSNLLANLSQELARNLLLKQATIIYGGDLRKSGFTEFIFEEASNLQSKMQSEDIKVRNYIAWPIYNDDTQDVKYWKLKYIEIAEMIEVEMPDDIKQLISIGENNENYNRARSLTHMRYEMIKNSDFRICAGGKHSKYSGRMPGVLEEILIAINEKKPIFLLGGFGGVTSSVCNMIENGQVPEKLTKKWQLENQCGYEDILNHYSVKGSWTDFQYEEINSLITFESLNNGLSENDNLKLFNTQFIEEAMELIIKGIKNIQTNSKKGSK